MKKRYKEIGELKLFQILWNISPDKRSLISGREIRSCSLNNCAHVLSKKQYPHFRLYLFNVCLLHSDEHIIYDQGTIEDRIVYSQKYPQTKWDILEGLKSELIDEYRLAFPNVSPEGIIMKYSDDEVKEKIRSLNKAYLDTLATEGSLPEGSEELLRIVSGL